MKQFIFLLCISFSLFSCVDKDDEVGRYQLIRGEYNNYVAFDTKKGVMYGFDHENLVIINYVKGEIIDTISIKRTK